MAGKRNPDKTREDLLQAAFEEIHRSGFRSADVPRILEAAGVTKGALYHHFGSKKGLGYAVLEEPLRATVVETWIQPLDASPNPIDSLIATLIEGIETADELATCGCPLNNLAQEMSPLDDGFRQRIERIYSLWRKALAKNLARGQAQGTVRSEIDPDTTAAFLVASLEGSIGLAKGSQDPSLLETCTRGVIQFLETLRSPPPATASAGKADAAAIH